MKVNECDRLSPAGGEQHRAAKITVQMSMSISVGTRKMVNYA